MKASKLKEILEKLIVNKGDKDIVFADPNYSDYDYPVKYVDDIGDNFLITN